MKFNIALFPVALIISGCTVQSDSTYNLALDEMTPKVIEMTLDKYQSQVVQVQSEFYLPPFKKNTAHFNNCDGEFIPRELIKYVPFISSEKHYFVSNSVNQPEVLKKFHQCLLTEFNKSPVPKEEADKFIKSIQLANVKSNPEINAKVNEITQDNILTFGELVELYNLLNNKVPLSTATSLKDAFKPN
ncbi:hypothetical protein [Acinetobacter nosocomialis]|uniref:hypothetical protein n=1 Tax=Acinetobacter nosocomialis TaxID=106654 RepID=UPI0029DAB97E|nr:hypothetical protein [Acinetobacter nosocomialis]MDX7882133.1 hypothetical protein [Acinetobacter nosocomialis]